MLKERTKSIIVSDCTYSILFCTKYRKPVLTDEIAKDLESLMRDEFSKPGMEFISIDIQPSYVVIRAKIDSQLSVHHVIRHVKAVAAQTLRPKYRILKTSIPSLWTLHYYVTTKASITEKELNSYLDSQQSRQEARIPLSVRMQDSEPVSLKQNSVNG